MDVLHVGPQGSWEGLPPDAGLVVSPSRGTAECPGMVLVGTGV